MANTPIYGFETPDDTDLVKDGALAIRTALDDVDTTLGTALNSNDYAGLVLVKKQTIGSAVSSVTVSDAFSATYTTYKIIVTGGTANTANPTYLQLGATATGYYSARPRVTLATGAITANATQNGTSIEFGYCETTGQAINAEITNPFLSTVTRVNCGIWVANTSIIDTTTGFLNNSTSYTAFTISSASSWTGGTIYVYGYGTS